MEVFRNNVKSGLFIMIALAIFLFSVFKVGGGLDRLRAGTDLILNFENADQVGPGTEVLLRGKKIGRVNDVTFAEDGHSVNVTCSIDATIHLFAGTRARISDKSTLGGKLVELIPPAFTGSEPPVLDPTQPIPGLPSVGLSSVLDNLNTVLAGIQGKIDTLFEKVEHTLDELDATIIEARTLVKGIGPVAGNLDKTLTAYRTLAEDLSVKTSQVLNHADQMILEIGPLATDIEKEFLDLTQQLKNDLSRIMVRIDEVLDNTNKMVTDADALILENQDELSESILTMKHTLHNFQVFSARIAEKPRALIFGGKRKNFKLPAKENDENTIDKPSVEGNETEKEND